jgi:ribosomal protein S18 acetylase RimI-like enzyme
METKIRLLQKKDIPAVARIILNTKAGSNKKEVLKLLNLSLKKGISFINPDYFVLFSKKNIIGISGLYYDYEDPKDILWMDYFAISPKVQHQGLGSILLQNLEIICKNKKVRRLCVFAETDQAINFYTKNGFKIFGKLEDYYGPGRPRVWLSKILA